MTDLKANPTLAPEYNQHRELTAAVDSLPETDKAHGINMSGNRYANIQVVPSGASDPTVVVLWWSKEAGKFVQEHTSISKTGVGAATPYEFTVECLGRIMFVAITASNAGATKVFVSGYELSPH